VVGPHELRGVDSRSGPEQIVIDRANFATDRFIVEGIAAERGLHIRWLEPDPAGGVRADDVRSAVGGRTAVVVLSHVAFRSGFLATLPAITRSAHEAGALILWDRCHSVGVVPMQQDGGSASTSRSAAPIAADRLRFSRRGRVLARRGR
jgi:kynureninase